MARRSKRHSCASGKQCIAAKPISKRKKLYHRASQVSEAAIKKYDLTCGLCQKLFCRDCKKSHVCGLEVDLAAATAAATSDGPSFTECRQVAEALKGYLGPAFASLDSLEVGLRDNAELQGQCRNCKVQVAIAGSVDHEGKLQCTECKQPEADLILLVSALSAKKIKSFILRHTLKDSTLPVAELGSSRPSVTPGISFQSRLFLDNNDRQSAYVAATCPSLC